MTDFTFNMKTFGLVKAAVEASGLALPWNLHHVEYSCVETGFRATMSDEKIVVAFAGWIRELNKFKAIRQVLSRTQSAGGMNSPYTTINLWDLFRKYPRALELEKKLWQTKERAQRILSAFSGQTPSWQLIAHAIMHTADPKRAGLIVAAGTLAHGQFNTTREAKEFLVRYHLCKHVDTSNQKRTLVYPIERHAERIGSYGFAKVYLAMDVEPFRPYVGNPEPLRFWWLVKSDGGRAFHYSYGESRESTPEEAVKAAKQAWGEQDKFLAENPDIAHFIMNGGEIMPEDWDGDYRLVIKHFIAEQRWSEMECFPALWLLPHLSMRSYYHHGECAVKKCLREAWRRVHPFGSPKQEFPQKVFVSEHVASVKEAGVKFKPSAWIQAERCEHNRAISGSASIFISGCYSSGSMAKLIKVPVRDLLFTSRVYQSDVLKCVKRLGYEAAEAADVHRFASEYNGEETIVFLTDEVSENGMRPYLFSGEKSKRIGLFAPTFFEPEDLIVFRAPKKVAKEKAAA